MTDSDISLKALFVRALQGASEYSTNSTPELAESISNDIRLVSTRVEDLHLFSANEASDDISTSHILYLCVPFIAAEIDLNLRTTRHNERMVHLNRAKVNFDKFSSQLRYYEIVPEAEKEMHSRRAPSIADPARRREWKISQFKKEREVKTTITDLAGKKGLEVDISNSFDLVRILLSSLGGIGDDPNDDDESIRKLSFLILRLQFAQMASHLESLEQETKLLRNAPPPDQRQQPSRQGQDEAWKLDQLAPQVASTGPLLDSSGRPLRPFTILPSTAARRAQLQGEVFRPDHRLPSMTVEEYLEEENRRGNIISGGGAQSASRLTRSEQLILGSEEDGLRQAEEKSEEKRLEDEQWAQFKEENPRGAGNTLNRG